MIRRIDHIAEKWLNFGLFLFMSSFIWSPSRDGLDAAYVLFILLPALILFVKQKISLSNDDPLIKLILLFCAYSAITTLWRSPKEIFFFLSQLLIISVWIKTAFWLAQGGKVNLTNLFSFLISIGCVVSLTAIAFFYGQTTYLDGFHFGERLNCWCSAENPNLIGGLFGILALISYILFISSDNNAQRFKYSVCCSVLILPVFLSQSRAALIGFAITAILAIFMIKPKARTIFAQVLVALPGVLLVLYFWNTQKIWSDRSTSMGDRDLIWKEILKQLPDNFFMGTGLSQNTRILIVDVDIFNHSHNSWLDTFFRTGLIGFLLIATITYMLLRKAAQLKSIEGKIFLLWFIFGIVLLTVDHRILFWQIDTKWFFYWIPVPFIIALYNKEKALNNL